MRGCVVLAAAFLVSALAVAAPAHAEGMMAVCGQEWKTAKAAGTTGDETWPQFLAQCRTQHAAAPAPAPAPAQQSGSLFPWLHPQSEASRAAPVGASGQSVMAICGEQWRQAKAAGTTGGATWPQFLAQCRAQRSASAAPAPAPAAPAPAPSQQSGSLFPWLKPSQTSPAPAPAPAPTAAPAPSQQSGSLFPWAKPAPSTTGGPTLFSSPAAAHYRCPNDAVVWLNTDSKIYHYEGSRYYGHTKMGGFACEGEAKASGARASRSREAGKNPG